LAISTICLSGTDSVARPARGSIRASSRSSSARGFRLHRAVVEEGAATPLAAEEDVLLDGQLLGEVELLVDEDDAPRLGLARGGEG
jgi:hypothetical protein